MSVAAIHDACRGAGCAACHGTGLSFRGDSLCDGSGLIDTPYRRSGIGEMIIETGGEQYECPGCEACGRPDGDQR